MRNKSILPILLFFYSWFAPLIAWAQGNEVTGRVVTEDGAGLPNVMVSVAAINAEGNAAGYFSLNFSAYTDEGGYFKFIESKPSYYYSISVSKVDGANFKPVLVNGRRNPVYTRIGANLTITIIEGGSISGRVTNAKGEPVIGAFVWAEMSRDAKGKPVRGAVPGRRRLTDDRGVYRLYGLAPGSYVVFTSSDIAGPFAKESNGIVPTYHQSSTRETAAEVVVTNGAETSGIDIRRREDRGHIISGSVPDRDVLVLLVSTGTGAGLNYVNSTGPGHVFQGLPPGHGYTVPSRQFEFRGLPDGDYYVVAVTEGDYTVLASTPLRISLRGSDVSGVELKPSPLGSINGRVVIETLPGCCKEAEKIPSSSLSISAIRDDLPKDDPALSNFWWVAYGSARWNEEGAFSAGHFYSGHFRLVTGIPTECYYVKAITLPAKVSKPEDATAAVSNISRDGVSLKQGEKLQDVVVTVAEGAASVRGKVIAKNTGARMTGRLITHLIPVEPEAADEVLRYAEAPVYDNGAFVLKNIAPGKYWLMARVAPNEEPSDRPSTPAAWDANERSRLRREAAAAKIEIELKPCQRVKDYNLRLNR